MIHALKNIPTITWEQYLIYTEGISLFRPEHKPYDHDKTYENTLRNLEVMKSVYNNNIISQKLYNSLSKVMDKYTWVCISEPWCGDAAYIVPIIFMISQCSSNIEFRIVLRDTSPDYMNNHLTNGSRSIPKLVIYSNSDGKELASWGPRPQTAQDQVLIYKDDPNLSYGQKVRKLNEWYESDHSKSIQDEFYELAKKITEHEQ